MTVLVTERGLSARRACRMMGLPRSSYYYEPRPRPERPVDPEVREAVLDVTRERPSFGYRRTTAMVHRNLGRRVNPKRVRRIMRQEGLTLEPFAQPRVRVRKHPGKQITPAPDLAYQMDLKYVWCGPDGWAYLQNVVECCTSEWLGYEFSKRCGGSEAMRLLDRVVLDRFPSTCRAPGTRLRVDNGPAYRSRAFLAHATGLGFDWEHIQKKTPEDNGVVESLHAGLDRDYLNLLVFDSFAEARAFIAWALDDYNKVKPQERLGWLASSEYYEKVKTSAN